MPHPQTKMPIVSEIMPHGILTQLENRVGKLKKVFVFSQ